MTSGRTTELTLTPDALVAKLNSENVSFTTINQIERLMYSPLANMFQMPIVLDFSDVKRIPRVMMQTLFKKLQDLRDKEGQRFILAGINEDEDICGDITWFRLRFEIYSSVEEALEALSVYSWRSYKPVPQIAVKGEKNSADV